MKKEFVILLTLLLLTSFALSADNETPTDKTSDLKDKVSSTKLGDIGNQTKAQANNILEKQLDIPSLIEIPAKIIFGIEDGISIQHLIIVLSLWIGFLIFMFSMAGLIPFLGEGILKFITAIIITALVSISGGLDSIATFFFDIAGFFKWTSSWGPLRTIIAILIAAIIIFIFSWYAHKMKRDRKVTNAERVARDMHAVSRLNRQQVRQELNQ